MSVYSKRRRCLKWRARGSGRCFGGFDGIDLPRPGRGGLRHDHPPGAAVRHAVRAGVRGAELRLIEKRLPGVALEWVKLGGGSAMNEALIAGKLDAAFMGIPPALIAIDKGVDYRTRRASACRRRS